MVSSSRQGFLYGLTAYLLWGGFPLYWPLLEPAGSVELLAHRIFWSLVTLAALVLVLRRTRQFAALFRDRRVFGLLTIAAVVITLNWGTYIYGVTNDRVVETSLGYFINPLVTVLMGVLILGERLRRLQWLAIGIGALACLVLTVDYGHPPWIALVLACSFGTYGLAKKQAGAEAIESLTLETMLVTPLALGYLVWLSAQGRSSFASEGTGHALLLMSAGLVTAVPLLCFGAAAIRVPMVTLGTAAVPRADPAVPPRRAVVPRGDVDRAGGSASRLSGWPWRSSPSSRCVTAAGRCDWLPRPSPSDTIPQCRPTRRTTVRTWPTTSTAAVRRCW